MIARRSRGGDDPMQSQREDVEFRSSGAVCRGWLYSPAEASPKPPCIVMAPGLGGTRTTGLEPYARRFAEAGLGVLLFDYRHFGASDGEPRQLFSVGRQLQDWASAIAFTRGIERFDPRRLALWGTSFSGGHVITAAARDGGVAAVVAQVPMMDALAATRTFMAYAGFGAAMRLTAYGLLDQLGAALGRKPVLVPLAGAPGVLAAMCAEDCEAGYASIAPPEWRNEISARYALTVPLYRPIAYARKVRCPVLVQVALHDSVAPAAAAIAAAERLPHARLVRYDCKHFEIYSGTFFERAVAEQVEFYREVLGMRGGAAGSGAEERQASARPG
jgi:uncharacterized protein